MEKKKNVAQLPIPLPLRILRSSFPVLESFAPGLARQIAVRFFLKPFSFDTPSREKDVDAAAEKSHLTFKKKQKIQVYQWGKSDEYVLCVHGWSGRATQYHAIIELLLEQGLTVVSFDAPAHHASEGKQTQMLEFSAVIKLLIEKYGSPKAIIGHSLGGIACMYYLHHEKKNFPLITINSPVIMKEIFQNYAFRLNAKPDNIKKWLTEHAKKRVGKDFYEVSGEYLSQRLAERKLLVCIDEDDREVSLANAELLKENMPWVALFKTEGFGHVRILRSEPLLSRIKQFVTELN